MQEAKRERKPKTMGKSGSGEKNIVNKCYHMHIFCFDTLIYVIVFFSSAVVDFVQFNHFVRSLLMRY